MATEAKRRSDRKRRNERREYVDKYLMAHPCVDCGENDPIVLDFDHRDPALKFKKISDLVSEIRSWESLITEISKCDVRCANCHRRKTYRDKDHLVRRKTDNKVEARIIAPAIGEDTTIHRTKS